MPQPLPTIRYTNRLTDKVLVAFHHACDHGDNEIAFELLHILEFMAMRMPPLPAGEAHCVQRSLVAAHERLWQAPGERQRGWGAAAEGVSDPD